MSSLPNHPVPYTKVWLSVPDQVKKLERRGLTVTDRSGAESFLRHVNYYCFTGYCLAFERSRDVFHAGVTFEHIQAAYDFDVTLRDLFNEALELIEIDLCTSVAHSFGGKYGAFGHLSPSNFHQDFDHNTTHAKWLDKLHEETKRSNELFIKHFRKQYCDYPNLPIWTVTEVMSFGGLSRMIAALHKCDRDDIAREYGVPARVLASMTHHFAYVRNLCAHHGRLWDRIWAIKSDLPNHQDWQSVSNKRLFSTLLLMRKTMNRISLANKFSEEWRDRLTTLLTAPPKVPDPNASMGLTSNWKSHPVWQ